MATIVGRVSEDIEELLEEIKTLKVKINAIRKWLHETFDIIPEDIKDILSSCDDLCTIRGLDNIQSSLAKINADNPENVAGSSIEDLNAPIECNKNSWKSTSPAKEDPLKVEVKDEYSYENTDLDPLGGLSPSYSTPADYYGNNFDESECSDNTDVKTLSSDLNKFIFTKKVVILLHDINKSKTRSQENEVVKKKKMLVTQSLSCELCQTNYDVQKDLEDHMEVHKVKVFICAHNPCKRKYTTQEGMDGHERRIHCQSCPRSFTHLINFTGHNDKAHSGKALISALEDFSKIGSSGNGSKKTCDAHEYQCSKCSELFKTLFNFKFHLERGCYDCKICGKKFSNLGILKVHINDKHIKERKFLCNSCGKTFRRASVLAAHTDAKHATEKKIFTCSSCDKTFISYFGYTKHMKSHEGTARELCTICGFDFASINSLNLHINGIHKNIRPYPCHLCDKRFKTKHAMVYHIKTHENPNGRKRSLNKDVDDIKAAAKRRNVKN